MRVSDWQIVWDPSGDGERTLLSLGDMMESDIRLPISISSDVGRPDFSLTGIPVSRGNRKRRVEFSRRDGHSSVLDAWQALFTELAADPWGLKKTLRITPRGGSATNYTAALLSSSHRVVSDGLAESSHSYAFRIVPQ